MFVVSHLKHSTWQHTQIIIPNPPLRVSPTALKTGGNPHPSNSISMSRPRVRSPLRPSPPSLGLLRLRCRDADATLCPRGGRLRCAFRRRLLFSPAGKRSTEMIGRARERVTTTEGWADAFVSLCGTRTESTRFFRRLQRTIDCWVPLPPHNAVLRRYWGLVVGIKILGSRHARCFFFVGKRLRFAPTHLR